MGKKTYVIVGLGGRHGLFRDAITGEFKNSCQLLALCDRNRGRLQKSLQETGKRSGYAVKGYHSGTAILSSRG